MLNRFKKWVYTWGNVSTVIACLFLLQQINLAYKIGALTIYVYIGLLICIIKVRLKKRKDTIELIERKRREWNSYFHEDSFYRYFSQRECKSSLFERLFEAEFQKKIIDDEKERQKKNSNQSNNSNQSKEQNNNQQKNKEKEQKRNENNNTENDNTSPINLALNFFGYKTVQEITSDNLKVKYRNLIKNCHPDNGGSIEKTQLLNSYYDMLKKYAA